MRFDDTVVITPKALGASLLSTVVLRRLAAERCGHSLRCVTQYPEIFKGLPYVDHVYSIDEPWLFERAIQDNEVIDLTGTLDFQPNRRITPLHLIDLLCRRANVSNDGIGPECRLSIAELNTGRELVASLRRAKNCRVVAMTTRTSTPNKEWPRERWSQLVERTHDSITWLHLGFCLDPPIQDVEYRYLTLREDIAVLTHVDGIVTLDTLLLHEAAAAHNRSVVVLLGSSHPDCVSYRGFANLYVENLDCQPCGRPYHPLDLAYASDGTQRLRASGKPRKWECEHVDCMSFIPIDMVELAIVRNLEGAVLSQESHHGSAKL